MNEPQRKQICLECGSEESVCWYGKKIGDICWDCYSKILAKRIENFDGDTQYTHEITCPHCGNVFGDSWEHNDDDGLTIICGDCENYFVLCVDVSVTYCTMKPKKENRDNDKRNEG